MENILSSKLFTTRRGTIIMGIVAAVLAGIVLLVYLNHYRNSVNGGGQPLSVLVAKSLIQKGTPGDVVSSSWLVAVRIFAYVQCRRCFVGRTLLAGLAWTRERRARFCSRITLSRSGSSIGVATTSPDTGCLLSVGGRPCEPKGHVVKFP